MAMPFSVLFRLRLEMRQFRFQFAQGDVAIDRVVERGTVQRRRFLRHVSHAPFGREIDLALVRVQFAAHHGEQARFARAIGADQADLVARVERDIDLFEQRFDAAHQAYL